MEKLKPCPFCGKEIEHYNIEFLGPAATRLEVRCDYCGAEISIEPVYFDIIKNNPASDDAISRWNRRENDDLPF